ncbi:type II toxin-antitoxin system RelE/ParE family toxin [Nesterenkonia ebinurensis]|uniref:type II toxin-antitoxin system RelE/ParE family toxin n=1 Tax=Nesterenkonia ebinurensis TaxID=2608252 RepID=UPI00168B71EC
MKPVELSPLAREDFLSTYRQYLLDAGPEVANRFSDMVDEAVTTITESPGVGSLRYVEILEVPGLRYITPPRFPYLIFYLEHPHVIRVERMLHTSSDIDHHFST